MSDGKQIKTRRDWVMTTVTGTPRTKTPLEPTTPPAPRTERVGTHIQASSPHYTTTRRHSLYGTEDRVILDPGSRVWKVGFSGEGRPRDVFSVGKESDSLWGLSISAAGRDRAEEERQLEAKMQDYLRGIFHGSLLTDPKSRKVIIVENPLLSLSVKEMLARILFGNLQVPSISFAPSPLLSLLAVGRMTGLVLDSGHLESTVLPVVSSRPLYPYLRTTPLAGSRLTSRIRSLLLVFGTYMSPPTTLSGAASIPTATRSTRVPEEVLTDAIIEEIKTRCCFVGAALQTEQATTPTAEDLMSVDILLSEPPSESTVSRTSAPTDIGSSRRSSSPAVSDVVHHPTLPHQARSTESYSQAMASLYRRHSTATDLNMKVEPPVAQQTGTGKGTLIIPGWIRERASELLFNGDVDESSVAEVVLESLINVPRDLRKDLASSILVAGGTAMLPGFIPRLHAELVRILSVNEKGNSNRRMQYNPYASLRPLLPYISILNNPSPPPSLSSTAKSTAGKAPAFSPAALPWVGGSLSGALKTGGGEILRERWDEAAEIEDGPDVSMEVSLTTPRRSQSRTLYVLSDWSRSPLPAGAPSATFTLPTTPLVVTD